MTQKAEDKSLDRDIQANWRFWLGATIFAVSFCSPLLIPIVTSSNLAMGWKTTLSGFLALGIPELGAIIAVAVMGKTGFDLIRKKFLTWLKRFRPVERVGPARYRIGLVMFCLPILYAWLEPYLRDSIFTIEPHWPFLLALDVTFISSFFVLGGEFWDKISSLFTRTAPD